MSAMRTIRIIDPLAEQVLWAEAYRDPRRAKRPPRRVRERRKPPRPEPWESRRREYLFEVGREEVAR